MEHIHTHFRIDVCVLRESVCACVCVRMPACLFVCVCVCVYGCVFHMILCTFACVPRVRVRTRTRQSINHHLSQLVHSSVRPSAHPSVFVPTSDNRMPPSSTLIRDTRLAVGLRSKPAHDVKHVFKTERIRTDYNQTVITDWLAALVNITWRIRR